MNKGTYQGKEVVLSSITGENVNIEVSMNQINSISKTNPKYDWLTEVGKQILKDKGGK